MDNYLNAKIQDVAKNYIGGGLLAQPINTPVNPGLLSRMDMVEKMASMSRAELEKGLAELHQRVIRIEQTLGI